MGRNILACPTDDHRSCLADIRIIAFFLQHLKMLILLCLNFCMDMSICYGYDLMLFMEVVTVRHKLEKNNPLYMTTVHMSADITLASVVHTLMLFTLYACTAAEIFTN
ncbi:hypothetical protein GDO81_010154 [Engystomops pustulosus]|uniref:Uncharacterized protein n=1 Tax=Engystomops pustulosus TaxID=76066 RepID=A0AAV7BXC7_ENGPU|nr:hypothetical protein GDO81_010154 [Engystomops pustulosus]